jgi:hypothetical protein
MPEIPNVISNEVIASEWGNDIRDRTIQRYADAAARTAGHVAPVQGDLSYLNSTKGVYVYNGSTWVILVPDGTITTAKIADDAVTIAKLDGAIMSDYETDVSNFDLTNPITTGSFANLVSMNLTIPAGWGSWKGYASASGTYSKTGGNLDLRTTIDTVDGVAVNYNFTPDGNNQPFAVQSYTGGRGGTGARAVHLMGRTSTGTGTVDNVTLYARAVRLT